MALTPDTPNEAFLREVDENLRRDQMEQFAKTYGKWLIAAVVLFLAAAGGYLYWQNKQQEKASVQSEELMAIYNDIGAGKTDQAKKRLQPLENANNDMVRTLTLLTEAAIALDSNDRDTALAKYRSISNGDGLPEAYRNLATIRATALEFDKLKPDEVITRLAPLSKPGEPWFGSAGEMTALAMIRQGKKREAGQLFATIAKDKDVPQAMRDRSIQIASSLGTDASAALEPQAQ